MVNAALAPRGGVPPRDGPDRRGKGLPHEHDPDRGPGGGRPDWHRLSAAEAARWWAVDPERGLDDKVAEQRLAEWGPNALPEAGAAPLWAVFAGQFRDFMVLVLLAAAGLSFFLGEVADTVAIAAIVLINAALGTIQEYRAERSLAALRRLAAPSARVTRGGAVREVPAADVVPGDMLLLEAGDRVAADARLVEAAAMEADEAPLTGESLPVAKKAGALREEEGEALGDRRNMVFQGTVVTRGRGRAVVVATGEATEMGGIAGLIQAAGDGATPLQRRLAQLGRYLVAACLAISALVVMGGILRGETLQRMILTGVSLAVAAIPEGLPAVVTIVLALGVQRMLARNAIVRRLPAVETLGCATVICSDKTGTLTRNQMTVRAIHAGGRRYEVTGEGYGPEGEVLASGRPLARGGGEIGLLLTAMILCNNAHLRKGGRAAARGSLAGQKLRWLVRGGGWQVEGDPTEGALLAATAKAGLDIAAVRARHRRVAEVPFESERKMMTVVCVVDGTPVPAGGLPAAGGRPEAGGPLRAFVKGAPERVLSLCAEAHHGGVRRPLSEVGRREALGEAARLAGRALRVLALAYREVTPAEARAADPAALEQRLVFLGLVGMMDPPRPEVKEAIRRCHAAGLRVAMVTGDHVLTARAVAAELGLLPPGGDRPEGALPDASGAPPEAPPAPPGVLTGADLDRLDDEALAARVEETAVYARVSPAHKLRIVRALRRRRHVVAMTGDGVNDAPALKEADIGVAMGRTGTEVTREASDMVLADDNFATIVAAVEEGRAIYDNIRKFIRYLLACNAGEVTVMLAATMLGWPLPLLPIHILLVNLVTDGLPAIALGVDPPEPGLMARPPRDPREGVFSGGLWRMILARGALIGAVTLTCFAATIVLTGQIDRARTVAMAVLSVCQLLYAFECRSATGSLRGIGLTGNPALLGAVASSVAVLVAVVHVPALQGILRTVPLTPGEWAAIFLAALAGSLFAAVQRLTAPGRRAN